MKKETNHLITVTSNMDKSGKPGRYKPTIVKTANNTIVYGNDILTKCLIEGFI